MQVRRPPFAKVSTSLVEAGAGGPLPSDEMRALVVPPSGGRRLAGLQRPDPARRLLAPGLRDPKMQATADLFETRLSTLNRVRGGPKPLRPLWNGLDEAKADPPVFGVRDDDPAEARRRPRLLRRALEPAGGDVSGRSARARRRRSRHRQVVEVNRLVADLTDGENSSFESPHHRGERLPRPARVVAEFLRRGHRGPGPGPARRQGRSRWDGPPRSRPTGPISAPRATWPPPSRGSTPSSTWPPGSRGPRTPSSPPPWSGPNGSWRRWRRTSTRRLVLASSFSVYDWSSIRGELTEASPVEPPHPTSTSATATPSPRSGKSGSPAGWPPTTAGA